MRKWLRDNPWIWIVIFFLLLIGSGIATLIIAELNPPILIPRS